MQLRHGTAAAVTEVAAPLSTAAITDMSAAQTTTSKTCLLLHAWPGCHAFHGLRRLMSAAPQREACFQQDSDIFQEKSVAQTGWMRRSGGKQGN